MVGIGCDFFDIVQSSKSKAFVCVLFVVAGVFCIRQSRLLFKIIWIMGRNKEVAKADMENIVTLRLGVFAALLLADYSRAAGNYLTFYEFRKLAKTVILGKNPKKLRKREQKQFLAALLENSYFADFKSYSSYVSKLINKKDQADVLNFGRFWFGNCALIGWHNEDNDFAKFISTKDIALVGPIEAQMEDGERIDSADVVIRFNYSFSGKGLDDKRKGKKVHVSYFMGHHGAAFLAEQGGEIPPELKWSCFKHYGQAALAKTDSVSSKKRVIRQQHIKGFGFHASFMALGNTLLDLLVFCPKSCTVYQNDLLLTVMRGKGYTPNSFKRKTELAQVDSINRSFHDPLTNFFFIRELVKNELIIPDAALMRAVSMDEFTYVELLDDLYGRRRDD